MAALTPTLQVFTDLRDGTHVVLTKVRILSASDTVTVPDLAVSTSGLSVKQIKSFSGEPTLTVTNSANVVTLAGGTAGDTATIASMTRQLNSDVRS